MYFHQNHTLIMFHHLYPTILKRLISINMKKFILSVKTLKIQS